MALFFFMGMVSVNAETCTFTRDAGGGMSEYYTITFSNGKVDRVMYHKRNSNGIDVVSENRTSSTKITFSSCNEVSSYQFGSNTFVRSGAENKDSNSNSGSNETPGWLSTSKVSCGNIGEIPAKAPEIVHLFILIAQIAVPIILVILGMIDFAKGIMSQKEDEIKKGQKTFINRLILGAIIFFIVALVKLLVGIVVDNSSNRNNIIACIDCFVNNDCG